MNLESDFLPQSRLHRIGTMLGSLARWPFALVIAILEWFVADVLSRLIALPWLLVTEVIGQVKRARIRLYYRLQLEQDAQELKRQSTAVETSFREILLAIDRADREHARLDPHFQESLVAAEETYRQRLQALTALARARNGEMQ